MESVQHSKYPSLRQPVQLTRNSPAFASSPPVAQASACVPKCGLLLDSGAAALCRHRWVAGAPGAAFAPGLLCCLRRDRGGVRASFLCHVPHTRTWGCPILRGFCEAWVLRSNVMRSLFSADFTSYREDRVNRTAPFHTPASFTSAPLHVIFIEVLQEWRNWQTQQTQNLALSQELGSIEVGKRADLLLLKENPLTNVSAYDSIEIIFLNGEPTARESLRSHN